MAEFYKGVQTESTGRVKSQNPTDVKRDKYKEEKAVRGAGGFGSAVQELLGITSTLVTGGNKTNNADESRMKKKSLHLVRGDLEGLPAKVEEALASFASNNKNGDERWKMTDQQRDSVINTSYSDHLESKGLTSAEYRPLLDKQWEGTANVIASRDINTQRKAELGYNLASLAKDVRGDTVAFGTNPSEAISRISGRVDTFYEAHGDRLGTNKKAIKENLFGALIKEGMIRGEDPKLMESPEFKKYFDNEQFPNFISMSRKNAAVAINKKRADNTSVFKAQFTAMADAGMIMTAKDVKATTKLLTDNFKVKPTKQAIEKVQKSVGEIVTSQNLVKKLKLEMARGNVKYLGSLKKSDRDSTVSAYVKESLGQPSLDTATISWLLSDPDKSEVLRQTLTELGTPVPEFTDRFNSNPQTLTEQFKMAEDWVLYKDAVASSGTLSANTVPLKRRKYLDFLDNLSQMQGLSAEKAAIQVSEYASDSKNFTNERGEYRSRHARKTLANESTISSIKSFVSDIPWDVINSYSSQYYRENTLKNIIALNSNPNMPDEFIVAKSIEEFGLTHTRFEQKNGDEGILPTEWKDVKQGDIDNLIERHSSLDITRNAASLLGLTEGTRGISFIPANDYGTSKEMMLIDENGTTQLSLTIKEFEEYRESLKPELAAEQVETFNQGQKIKKDLTKNKSQGMIKQ